MPRDDERPVQQSVLDRLIDLDPGREAENPPTRSQSVRALKTAVRRDLEWLLNTRATVQQPPESYDELRHSVYVYGLSDLTGLSGDNPDDRIKLQRMIERAIATFEPRLSHVKVIEAPPPDERVRQVRFLIQASLKMDPSPEQVVFDTVLDLSRGQYAVKGE
jgi:type VI secretion system protein ImpF